MLKKILRNTKLVKELIAENEDLRHQLATEKAVTEISKKNMDEAKKEAVHAKAVIYAILAKSHMCKQSKTGKLAIILEQNEIEAGIGKKIHEDLNFPRTSITVYPE